MYLFTHHWFSCNRTVENWQIKIIVCWRVASVTLGYWFEIASCRQTNSYVSEPQSILSLSSPIEINQEYSSTNIIYIYITHVFMIPSPRFVCMECIAYYYKYMHVICCSLYWIERCFVSVEASTDEPFLSIPTIVFFLLGSLPSLPSSLFLLRVYSYIILHSLYVASLILSL